MILVFDLDHTLYDETQFVRGGFMAVATMLGDELDVSVGTLFKEMWALLEANGRGQVFDDVLNAHGMYSKANLAACVSVYRRHSPSLKLFPDASRCLTRYRSLPKYVVTDGNNLVQANKVDALPLEGKIKKAFLTHRYGLHNAKPSTACFVKIAELERAPLSEMVYVGDDPIKDFVNLKPLGIKTVRVLRGPHKDVKASKKFDADISIRTLDELDLEGGILRQ